MKKRISGTILIFLLIGMFVTTQTVYAATPAASLGTDYPKVMAGSTVGVNVYITIPPYQSMNCVNVQITATGGFSVLTGMQYFSRLTSSKTVTFKVRAPSNVANGTINGKVTYSGQLSCGGTISTIMLFGVGVSSASPWVLNLSVNKSLCKIPLVLSGDPGAYVVSSKTKSFTTNTGEVASPFGSSVKLNPSPDTYIVTFGYTCILPIPPEFPEFHWAITKTISVTGSGQTLYFP